MKYEEFRQQVAPLPFFKSNIFAHLTSNPNLLRRQLSDWIKKGYVLKLKRGVYTLRHRDREHQLSNDFLSYQLYPPSYISLERALSHYGLIPETVVDCTAVTTRKTQSFNNEFSRFSYQKIQTKAFSGFIKKKDDFGLPYFIATPEKALVDFFYFKFRDLAKYDVNVFDKNFRLQNLEDIDRKAIVKYSQLFNKIKLNNIAQLFLNYLGLDKGSNTKKIGGATTKKSKKET